jgi:ParG
VRAIEKPQLEGVKRLNINVPFSLHNQFKATTAATGENMTDVLLEMIRQYVDQHSVTTTKKKGRK